MRTSLVVIALLSVPVLFAQDVPGASDGLSQRHHLSVDLIRLAARQPNLRYGYSLSTDGELFGQFNVRTPERQVTIGSFLDDNFEIIGSAPSRTEVDVYLGYRHYLTDMLAGGRLFVEGAANAKFTGDWKEEFLALEREADPQTTLGDVETPPGFGFVAGVGAQYAFRGGWSLEARLCVQANYLVRVRRNALNPGPQDRQGGYLFELFGPASSLLSIGKQF